MLGTPQPNAASDPLGLRKKQEQKQDTKDKRRPTPRGGRGSGSDNELDFRDNYDVDQRRIPVAVVLLHDDYSPPSGLYYFRQGAFSKYNGRRLVASGSAAVDNDVATAFVTQKRAIAEVPNQRGDRATVETTVALLADHKRPFALESPLVMEPARNPDPGRFRRIYRVTSASLSSDINALLTLETGDPTWSKEIWRIYTEPPNDPRYKALARQIVEQIRVPLGALPVAQTHAIAAWLSREGIYSLKSGHAQAADPTADFLFGDKTGYCVHFAHAAAYLMRTLGIPSRVAHGYAIEEAARRGGSAIVLSGENSHAWPEVYLAGVGWTVVDIFVERTLDPPPKPPDPDLQRLLGQMARGERPLPFQEGNRFESLAYQLRQWAKRIGVSLAYGAIALLIVLYLTKLWRRVVPRLARPRDLSRLLYRVQLDRFSEVRRFRRFGETREQFAERMSDVSPAFTALTQAHLRDAFGSRIHLSRSELYNLAQRIRTEQKSALPTWQRVLGTLVPWSFLQSR
jgi:transglutaminase-like putative cysteine protease